MYTDFKPEPKKLSELLSCITVVSKSSDNDPLIAGIAIDSRAIRHGDLFVAYKGFTADGHAFIQDAINRGAAAIVCDQSPEDALPVPIIATTHARAAAGKLADMLYDHPSKDIKVIGITGTNGKTTSAWILSQLLAQLGHKTLVVGTLGDYLDGNLLAGARTTGTLPEAIEVSRLLSYARKGGATYALIEATSIGLALDRFSGIRVHAALFTNLTQDHLDFHKNMDEYLQAKAALFKMIDETGVAALNADDPATATLSRATHARLVKYGKNSDADYRMTDINLGPAGVSFHLNGITVRCSLPGLFNVYNAAGCLSLLDSLNFPLNKTVPIMDGIKSVPGRLEHISVDGRNVYIDYAHTPDALENVLMTLNQIKGKGRIITVIGCGGDRDRTKRPIMGSIAEKMSDHCIFTSDNPRTENPHDIILMMVKDIPQNKSFDIIENRKDAIHAALRYTTKGDIILIAGKGHENYQEIAGIQYPFDDRVVAMEWATK